MIENNNKPVVFVVDDDPHIREALHGLIRSLQLNVQTFGTTDEFLNYKRPEAPGCIVLDVRTPWAQRARLSKRFAKIKYRSSDHLHHRTW